MMRGAVSWVAARRCLRRHRLLSFPLALALPATLLASEGAPHAEAHAPSIGELLFPAINFAIFMAIIVRYVVPALREFLRRRAKDIATQAEGARTALSTAERMIEASRRRHGGIAAEGDELRRDVVTAASRQAERLQAQADATGQRRVADAALLAEQERRRALLGVREETAALATELAEQRLRATLSAADQRVFVSQFLTDVPAR